MVCAAEALSALLLKIAECLATSIAMVHLRIFLGGLALGFKKEKRKQQDDAEKGG